MAIPKTEVLSKAVMHIKECFSYCEKKLQHRHEDYIDIYEAFYKMKEDDPFMTFKVNKAHEIVEKVVPDFSARDPRWVVSVRDVTAFNVPKKVKDIEQELEGRVLTKEQKQKVRNKIQQIKMEAALEQANAIQNYLTYEFDEYFLMEIVELWAKAAAVYGKAWAGIDYEWELAYLPEEREESMLDEEGNEMYDDEGEPMMEKVKGTKDKVAGEHPTIELIDWPDIYYDPRYIFFHKRPYHIRVKENVRLADLKRATKREEYFNVDKLEELLKLTSVANTQGTVTSNEAKQKLRAITGLDADITKSITDKTLTLRIYYGKYCLSDKPEDEKLYKITTVSDALCIGMKEIQYVPLEEIKCFPDTNTAFAKGFVEPIIGLQEEINFKKNAAAEYINTKLRKRFLWSEKSGIDPRDLNKQVIVAQDGVAAAKANFEELEMQDIAPSYFGEQNDLERQVQSLSFTIDTSTPRNQNALTNTATGARIKFFESSSVREMVRKRFERGLARLAYKLLMCAFESIEDNIVIRKMGAQEYFEMNKEVLRDALTKYTIKIETNSSSFTDIESRRDDALAFLNISNQIDAKLAEQQSPRRIDFIKIFEDIGATFEKKDIQQYLTAPNAQGLAQQLMGVSQAPGQVPPAIPGSAPKQTGAQKLTEEVAGAI